MTWDAKVMWIFQNETNKEFSVIRQLLWGVSQHTGLGIKPPLVLGDISQKCENSQAKDRVLFSEAP